MEKDILSQFNMNPPITAMVRSYENGIQDALGWVLREVDKSPSLIDCKFRSKVQSLIINLNDKHIDEFCLFLNNDNNLRE